MNETLRFLSLNMECDKHYDTVLGLILERDPDILCLQEAPKPFAELLGILGYNAEFKFRAHVHSRINPDAILTEGMVIAWKPHVQLSSLTTHVYRPRAVDAASTPQHGNDVERSLIIATLSHGTQTLRVGTTHFTWTPDGGASTEQHRDLDKLLEGLTEFHDETGIIFCGDFNAPRGGEIFARLNERYLDHIPVHITSTIDPTLHRAPHLNYVVDGLFSTPQYTAEAVEAVEGVSDHKAIFALIRQRVG